MFSGESDHEPLNRDAYVMSISQMWVQLRMTDEARLAKGGAREADPARDQIDRSLAERPTLSA